VSGRRGTRSSWRNRDEQPKRLQAGLEESSPSRPRSPSRTARAGSLRYRGIDIEELVGHYPYENVWGLLVDDDSTRKMPDPEPYEPAALTGNAPADLQAETARLAGDVELGKLNEISDEQAREDLGRLSVADDGHRRALGARGRRPTDQIPDDVSRRGRRRRRSSCCAGVARPIRVT
jgi:hypothetical protein